MTKHVNESEFESAVLNNTKPVLVDFWAEWCGPCRMLGPILDEVSSERTDIEIVKVNVDENGSLAQQYGVSGIPAMFLFANGKMIGNRAGLMKKADLIKWIDECTSSN
jgi:thioredoxin 1